MSIKREDIEAGRVDFSDIRNPRAKPIPPTHPSEILRDEFLAPFGLSAYRLAKGIGVRIPLCVTSISSRRPSSTRA